MKDKKTKIPNCWICLDEGLVYYFKKENGIEYEMVASCKCKKGLEYRNAAPSASDILSDLTEWIAETNFKKWKEKNPELAEKLIREAGQ